MNIKLKIKLNKVKVIVILWVLVAVIISVYDHLLLESEFSIVNSNKYAFKLNIGFNVFAALMGSIMGGFFLVFYMEEKAQDMSYGRSILLVSFSYIIIVSIVTVILGFIYVPIYSEINLLSNEGIEAYLLYLLNPIHLKNTIFWSMIVALTQFILQVDNKFGKGILWKFIIGKYKNPVQEKRVFMFLDLKSSTSIAEQLGNKQYHEFLRDFFKDITNAIIFNKGEIYQYVGDEVVISWEYEHGIEGASCLKCFYDMKKSVANVAYAYKEKYGVIPKFKAGIHSGNVIAGEIGIMKREITFSGDVLNTTARIQSMCNKLGADILLSDELADELADFDYKLKPVGLIALKGKRKEMALSTIE
jgi:adenylate cyclase